MRIERSVFSGSIVETKEININGVAVGVVKGYIATWKPDVRNGIYGVKDRILPGAYAASILEHKSRNNRQVRLKSQHQRVIGGFPIETVREDATGLYGEGHINLALQEGLETYSLARQRVLVDFSVGHIVGQDEVKSGFRNIKTAQLIEGSIVDEPANQGANIMEVKGGVRSDLPILDNSEYKWNEEEARARVMELKYMQGNASDAFIGTMLIADFVDDKLQAVPEALRIAATEVKSTQDQLTLERYFAKMGEKSPFESKMFYTLDDVKSLTKTELKDLLSGCGVFSNGAVRAIISRMDDERHELGTLLERIHALTNNLKTK